MNGPPRRMSGDSNDHPSGAVIKLAVRETVSDGAAHRMTHPLPPIPWRLPHAPSPKIDPEPALLRDSPGRDGGSGGGVPGMPCGLAGALGWAWRCFSRPSARREGLWNPTTAPWRRLIGRPSGSSTARRDSSGYGWGWMRPKAPTPPAPLPSPALPPPGTARFKNSATTRPWVAGSITWPVKPWGNGGDCVLPGPETPRDRIDSGAAKAPGPWGKVARRRPPLQRPGPGVSVPQGHRPWCDLPGSLSWISVHATAPGSAERWPRAASQLKKRRGGDRISKCPANTRWLLRKKPSATEEPRR